MELNGLRKRIDRIDDHILVLLAQRAGVVQQINRIKNKKRIAAFSPERERVILKRLRQLNKSDLKDSDIELIFKEIFSVFRALRGTLTAAFLGPEGTFTHQAVVKNFGKKVNFLSCESIDEVFSAVEKGHAEYGVVPVENSNEGVVNYTLDMFFDSFLKICAEVTMTVRHNLLAQKGAKKIKRIYSNPQVFAQCRKWLSFHMAGVELIPAVSTARAACEVKKDRNGACLGSRILASLYGLSVLYTSIQDSASNITRFLVVSSKDSLLSGDDKTSILFSVKDKAGALYDALYSFKKSGINMTKIESRPSKKKAWEYYFFVDIQGHRTETRIQKSLKDLEKRCNFVKILGSYPRGN